MPRRRHDRTCLSTASALAWLATRPRLRALGLGRTCPCSCARRRCSCSLWALTVARCPCSTAGHTVSAHCYSSRVWSSLSHSCPCNLAGHTLSRCRCSCSLWVPNIACYPCHEASRHSADAFGGICRQSGITGHPQLLLKSRLLDCKQPLRHEVWPLPGTGTAGQQETQTASALRLHLLAA